MSYNTIISTDLRTNEDVAGTMIPKYSNCPFDANAVQAIKNLWPMSDKEILKPARSISAQNPAQTEEIFLYLCSSTYKVRISSNIGAISDILASMPTWWTKALTKGYGGKTTLWPDEITMCTLRTTEGDDRLSETEIDVVNDFYRLHGREQDFDLVRAEVGQLFEMKPWVTDGALFSAQAKQEMSESFISVEWNELNIEGVVTLAFFHHCVKKLRKMPIVASRRPFDVFREKLTGFCGEHMAEWAATFLPKLAAEFMESALADEVVKCQDRMHEIEEADRVLAMDVVAMARCNLEARQHEVYHLYEEDRLREAAQRREEEERRLEEYYRALALEEEEARCRDKYTMVVKSLNKHFRLREEQALARQFATEDPDDYLSHPLKIYWLAQQQRLHDEAYTVWVNGRVPNVTEPEKQAWERLAKETMGMLKSDKTYIRLEPEKYLDRVAKQSWGIRYFIDNTRLDPGGERLKAAYRMEQQRQLDVAKKESRKIAAPAQIRRAPSNSFSSLQASSNTSPSTDRFDAPTRETTPEDLPRTTFFIPERIQRRTKEQNEASNATAQGLLRQIEKQWAEKKRLAEEGVATEGPEE